MVSRGLVIKECPSKQVNKNIFNDNSDNDDIPDPEDDEDKEETSDDAVLRDKRETEEMMGSEHNGIQVNTPTQHASNGYEAPMIAAKLL